MGGQNEFLAENSESIFCHSNKPIRRVNVRRQFVDFQKT